MELISKEDAVALITAEMDKIRTHSLVDGTARINLRLAKNIIEDMPNIDLIRCKSCKHWSYGKDLCNLHDMGMLADDFCSYGEKRDEKCKECWYWSEVHKRCENKCGCQFKPYAERKSDE